MTARELLFPWSEALLSMTPRSNDGGTVDTSDTKTDRGLGGK